MVRNPTSSLDASPRLPAGPLARSAVSRTVSGGVEMQASGESQGPPCWALSLCVALLLMDTTVVAGCGFHLKAGGPAS